MLAALQPRRLAGFLGRAGAPAGRPARRRGRGQLGRHLSRGDEPAELAHRRSPDSLDPAGPAPCGRSGRRWTRTGSWPSCRPARARSSSAARSPRLAPASGGVRRSLRDLLWWTAAALALRSVFEPVMVAFYLWPGLAVALIASTWSWRALLTTSAVAVGVSFGAQSDWRSPWGWWGLMVAGLGLTLLLAGVPSGRPVRPGWRRSQAWPGARPAPAPRMRGATAECRSTGPLRAAGP